jgi:hypothetical protein
MHPNTFLLLALFLLVPFWATAEDSATVKTSALTADTPAPTRFVVKGTSIIDLARGKAPVFLKGIGYSPYLQGETPIYGASPGNDDRYAEHVPLMRDLGLNYIHVFPLKLPARFFEELDRTDLLYGQDIWVWAYEEDFLDEQFLNKTLTQIYEVIDHTYAVGRPDRLVFFSVGDELQADAVMRTDARHPDVRDFTGRHIVVRNRTPTEIALARLIDGAIEYELQRYGRRHLYCHTSWTHIGPIGDRPDLEVPRTHMITPDLGDLVCLNVYTYARGVRTSPPGSITGTTYQGYLEDLAASTQKPIVITQVGLSTSPFEPKAWVPGFGGHPVEDVPDTYRAVWNDLRTAWGREKFAGLVFFQLHDEWWKSGEDPTDATRHERQDPEEWFGIYEIVPETNKLAPKGNIPETVRYLFGDDQDSPLTPDP